MIHCQFFRHSLLFAMTVTKAFYSGYVENIDFLKNRRLDSHKNDQNQRKLPTSNENKFLFSWFTANFSKYTLSFAMTVTKFLTVLTKKNNDFLKNGRLSSHKFPWNPRRVQWCNENKL